MYAFVYAFDWSRTFDSSQTFASVNGLSPPEINSPVSRISPREAGATTAKPRSRMGSGSFPSHIVFRS